MNKDKDWEKEIRKNVIYDEAETGSPWDIDDLVAYVQKQITKAYNEGRREGVKGFVYYLFPSEMYHSSDVKDEFWWSRGDAFIEAEKYLKSLKDKK